MSWFEFLERLEALTEDTVFGRVLQIRTAKVPAPTPNNREQREALLKAKARVALRKKAAGRENMDAMWDRIAEMLMEQAKKG